MPTAAPFRDEASELKSGILYLGTLCLGTTGDGLVRGIRWLRTDPNGTQAHTPRSQSGPPDWGRTVFETVPEMVD